MLQSIIVETGCDFGVTASVVFARDTRCVSGEEEEEEEEGGVLTNSMPILQSQ